MHPYTESTKIYVVLFCRLHGELRRSIEAQIDAARHGEGESLPALSREMMDNMQQQLQLLTQVYTGTTHSTSALHSNSKPAPLLIGLSFIPPGER